SSDLIAQHVGGEDQLSDDGFVGAKGPALEDRAVLQNQISLFHGHTSFPGYKKMAFPQSLRRNGSGKNRISGKTEAKAKTLIGDVGKIGRASCRERGGD